MTTTPGRLLSALLSGPLVAGLRKPAREGRAPEHRVQLGPGSEARPRGLGGLFLPHSHATLSSWPRVLLAASLSRHLSCTSLLFPSCLPMRGTALSKGGRWQCFCSQLCPHCSAACCSHQVLGKHLWQQRSEALLQPVVLRQHPLRAPPESKALLLAHMSLPVCGCLCLTVPLRPGLWGPTDGRKVLRRPLFGEAFQAFLYLLFLLSSAFPPQPGFPFPGECLGLTLVAPAGRRKPALAPHCPQAKFCSLFPVPGLGLPCSHLLSPCSPANQAVGVP